MKLHRAMLPLAAAILLAACGRGPAQSILTQADGALSKVKDGAATNAPHELKDAQDTYAHMKQSFDSKDYEAVKAEVPKFNEQIVTLNTAMEENQGKVEAAVREWHALNTEVPKTVADIQQRVDSLKPGKLPKGVTREEFDAAKVDLESMKATWAEATALAQNANPIEATEKARAVQAKAAQVKSTLGMESQIAMAH